MPCLVALQSKSGNFTPSFILKLLKAPGTSNRNDSASKKKPSRLCTSLDWLQRVDVRLCDVSEISSEATQDALQIAKKQLKSLVKRRDSADR